MQGRCKLCLKDDVRLQESHFMPAGLYGYCRHPDFSPVRIGGGIVIPTDRQTLDYLLCQSCEQVLNDSGETWLVPKLARMDRAFPFYDLLTRVPPLWNEDGMTLYLASQNNEIKVNKLVHFAMGIFWKASVHPWMRARTDPWIKLGPYSDNIRKWLLGTDSFPDHIYLNVLVLKPEQAQIVFNEPYEGKRKECRRFLLHVPGISFTMSVGKVVPDETKSFCVFRHPEHPIFVSESMSVKVAELFADQFHRSRKTKAFLESKTKRNRGKSNC